jgi:hypothetical protein
MALFCSHHWQVVTGLEMVRGADIALGFTRLSLTRRFHVCVDHITKPRGIRRISIIAIAQDFDY